MSWEEVVDLCVADGAIRMWDASKAWRVFYRILYGKWEARMAVKSASGSWVLPPKLVGKNTETQGSGWVKVNQMHHRATQIENERAYKNSGYYAGMVQRCETCKVLRPLSEFSRQKPGEFGFRTWECNICAATREKEVRNQQGEARVGDYLRRQTHASKPPVEGEI